MMLSRIHNQILKWSLRGEFTKYAKQLKTMTNDDPCVIHDCFCICVSNVVELCMPRLAEGELRIIVV